MTLCKLRRYPAWYPTCANRLLPSRNAREWQPRAPETSSGVCESFRTCTKCTSCKFELRNSSVFPLLVAEAVALAAGSIVRSGPVGRYLRLDVLTLSGGSQRHSVRRSQNTYVFSHALRSHTVTNRPTPNPLRQRKICLWCAVRASNTLRHGRIIRADGEEC